VVSDDVCVYVRKGGFSTRVFEAPRYTVLTHVDTSTLKPLDRTACTNPGFDACPRESWNLECLKEHVDQYRQTCSRRSCLGTMNYQRDADIAERTNTFRIKPRHMHRKISHGPL
jgi:hypothetical protein